MPCLLKSSLVTLAAAAAIASMFVVQIVQATPIKDMSMDIKRCYPDYPDDGNCVSGDATHVPVPPIKVAAITDFLPINNVQPVVNVLPTDVNDYSDYYDPCYCGGQYDPYDYSYNSNSYYDPYDSYDSYGPYDPYSPY
ncbi:hypothetical protein BX616_002166, partial [Lobosporangium transversale]